MYPEYYEKISTIDYGNRYKKGMKFSEKVRQAMSKGRKGIKAWNSGLTKHDDPRIVAYWEGKKRLHMTGEKHPFWKGGTQPHDLKERARFRKTIQERVFKRDKYTCQICGAKRDLHVDHIQKWSEYVEGRFSMDNCRTVCRACHFEITYGYPMPKNSTWGKYRKEVGSYTSHIPS